MVQQLTQRQSDVYTFLRNSHTERGYWPTVREIAAHFGIRSPNGVFCHLQTLEKKGWIRRESNLSRAITITHEPKVSNKAIRFAGTIS